MATEVKLPSLGKKAVSVDVLDVKVGPGDEVAKGQPLLEIESDKGTADVPSPVAGRVTELRVKKDDKIKSGQILCLIETSEGAPAKQVKAGEKRADGKVKAPAAEEKPEPPPSRPAPPKA